MSVSCNKFLRLPSAFANSQLLVGNKRFGNTIKTDIHIFSRNIHRCRNLAAKVAFTLSDIGEGIREVVVKEWYVNVGDKVAQFDNICEVQSDKASVTITSRYDGIVSKLYYGTDDIALVGKPLVDIETDEVEESTLNESTSKEEDDIQIEKQKLPEKQTANENIVSVEEVQEIHESQQVLCIPSVRRLAKEYNVNLSSIKGTGKNGRILKEDILEHIQKKTEPQHPKPVVALTEEKVEPIKGFQKIMVKTMTDALNIPTFVFSDEIKVTKLSEIRKSLKALPELEDVKLSFLPFFIKASSNALHRHPIVNSSVDQNCENIIYHKNHNIGIAMDTKAGLAVPVIKKVESLSILEIAAELNRLIKSGREGSFSPNDLTGGTFAISNIGVIGGTYTKPIILPPQVAIIALGASQVLPRFDESRNIIAEEIVNISASADHRIIDGATMANFTQILKRQIENPYLLLLNI